MARNDNQLSTQLERDLADLRLLEIARCYRDVLDDAARKGSSMLQVLATLIGMEQTVRQQRALDGGCGRHGCLNKRLWPTTTSTFPNGFPRQLSCVSSIASSSRAMAAPF
jgi:hypothetical protein